MVKHSFMTLIWRIQQSQALVAPIFWAATLAGVFWPVVFPYLTRRGLPPNQVGLGLAILFLAMLGIITLMGIIYDRVLKLWREQVDVGVERNPYYREKLAPKEIVLWRRMHLRTLQQVSGDDSKAVADAEFMERWIQRSLEDPRIRAQVDALERWISEPRPGRRPSESGGVVTARPASNDQR